MSRKRKTVKAEEVPLIILTNERTPFKAQQILMLYKAASIAQLAYMDGMDPVSGEVHPLLVGLEPTANGQFKVFPLARLLSKLDEIPNYLVPDGQGNYINYLTNESSEEESGPSEEGLASSDIGRDSLGGTPNTTIQ